ncbi:MAG: tetratricopeptide repeat protein [Proteobacteria bacterium]|nr:tetratricopeptide repeat protein [Pseudomonadota bacterium]
MTKLIRLLLILPIMLVGISACDKPEDQAADYIARGNKLYEAGDYTRARLEYKNAARLTPTSADVRYRLGLIDEAQEDFQNAYANYVAAVQQDKDHMLAHLKIALFLIAGDQLEEASTHVAVVLAQTPNNAEAHAIRAAILLRKGDLNASENDARFALHNDPLNVTAYSVLTGLYEKQGKPDSASQILDEALSKMPSNISLRSLQITLFEKINQPEKAAQAYQQLIKTAPNDNRYKLTYVAFLNNHGQSDQAEAYLKQSTDEQPTNWDLKRALIKLLSSNKKIEEAETTIKSYIEQNPNRDELYYWLTELYISNNDVDKASNLLNDLVKVRAETEITSLDARSSLARIEIIKGNKELAQKLIDMVLKHAPGHTNTLLLRAEMYMNDGFIDQAIADLRTVIRDQPQRAMPYRLLAEALLTQNRTDLAIDTLVQLIQRDSSNETIADRIRLAQYFDASGNSKQGLEVLNQVRKVEPDNAFVLESIIRLATHAHDFDLAESTLAELEKKEGKKPLCQLLRAKLLMEQDKKTEAVMTLRDVISTDPTQPVADYALDDFSKLANLDEIIDLLSGLSTQTAQMSYILGQAYLKTGDKQNAIQKLDHAIAQRLKKEKLYTLRAQLFNDDKAHDKAIAILQTGAQINPDSYIIPLMIADIHTKQAQYDEALKIYDQILDRNTNVLMAANNMADLVAEHFYDNPDLLNKARLRAERFIGEPNPLLLDTLAWVYYRQGKTNEALTIMERAMAMGNDLPPLLYYHYGAMLLKSGNRDKAKEQLLRATPDGASYNGLDQAKALLKDL